MRTAGTPSRATSRRRSRSRCSSSRGTSRARRSAAVACGSCRTASPRSSACTCDRSPAGPGSRRRCCGGSRKRRSTSGRRRSCSRPGRSRSGRSGSTSARASRGSRTSALRRSAALGLLLEGAVAARSASAPSGQHPSRSVLVLAAAARRSPLRAGNICHARRPAATEPPTRRIRAACRARSASTTSSRRAARRAALGRARASRRAERATSVTLDARWRPKLPTRRTRAACRARSASTAEPHVTPGRPVPGQVRSGQDPVRTASGPQDRRRPIGARRPAPPVERAAASCR